jgi:hypothetical protein
MKSAPAPAMASGRQIQPTCPAVAPYAENFGSDASAPINLLSLLSHHLKHWHLHALIGVTRSPPVAVLLRHQ